jgi:Spy/CpxP family protein refolding chaperone
MINWAELDLSEEQKDQIQQKSRDFQVNTAEIRQKLQFAQQDLRAEMREEPVDQAKVDSLWADITSLKQQIAEVEAELFLEIKNLLTPEQLEKLRESEATAQELRELKAELREILLAPGEPDAAKVKELQAKIAEKEVALQKERVENFVQKMESLTPEQRQQMKQFRSKRQK